MTQNTIYVFDLDGVITNPEDSSVDDVTVRYIYKLLEGSSRVAINTGRSYEWAKTNLMHALRGMGGHALCSRLYVVCEKGGESLIWEDGDFRPQPSRFAMHKETIATCKRIFDDNAPELGTMFWDATKVTMATIEKRPEASLEQFHQQQRVLADKLEEAFRGRDVRVDATTIATDIELPGAGKHAGAELIYEWAATQAGAEKTAFVCFGDSKSDYEMARYFASQGAETTFVFVGKKDDALAEHDGVRLVRTDGMYSAGTREFFRHLFAQDGHDAKKV